MKKRGKFWAHAYPVFLFSVIVLALLFLVSAGTELYSEAVDGQTRNKEARATLSYLTARVHAADAQDAVAVGEGPEGASILLRETSDTESYETRIYLYEGALREEYAAAEAPVNPAAAEKIADAEYFSVTESKRGLLTVETEYGTVQITLRCAEEVPHA